MRRIYYFLFSVILNIVCTPPIWASGTIAGNNSNGASTTTDAQVTNALWQDTNPNGANYLDRRHALVGANCMVNRLNTTVSVGQGTAHLENLVDKDLTNSAKFINGVNANLISGLTGATGYVPAFTIRDVKHVYKAGTTAGFVVNMDNSVLKAKAIDAPMKIYFYKDGEYKGEASCEQKSGSLLNLQVATISNNTLELTAIAPCDFDEVGLGSANLLDASVVGVMTMKYAFVGKNGKYYIDNETTNGINDFKTTVKKEYPQTEFLNDQLVLGRCFLSDGSYSEAPDDWIIDNRSSNKRKGSTIPITVSAYGGNDNKNMPFKAGMTIGFEVGEGELLSIAHYLKVNPYILTKNVKGKRTWTKQEADGGEFTLLGLNIGAGHRDVVATLKSDCNAAELSFGGVNIGATVAYRMFVVLPPSIDDDDPHLSVSADRSLCDEHQSMTLHSNEDVTWTCKGPTGSSVTIGDCTTTDNKTWNCEVSGFKYAGTYTFTATAKDGSNRTAETNVTYGISPVIDTAIRPWVNNFTEKGVSYNTDGKGYMKKNKITSFSLIPEIVTDKDNLVTPSLDDYVSAGGISLANASMLCGVFRSVPYSYNGTNNDKVTVGFVTRTKWNALNLSLLNGLEVRVYNSGSKVKTISSNNSHFKVLSADLIGGDKYVTTEYSVEVDQGTQFDAITLWSTGLLQLNLSDMNVYYAFVEPSAKVNSYNNSVASSWQTISHSQTGAYLDANLMGSNIGVAKVATSTSNLTDIIDDDLTTGATFEGLASVGNSNTIAVKLGKVYDGGHQVQILTSEQDWVNVGVAKFVTLKAYRDGNVVSKKTNWNVLDVNVIGGMNKESEILWTPVDENNKPVDFDEISITFTNVANVINETTLYGIRITNDADGDGIIDANDDESCPNEAFLLDENEPKLDKIHDFANTKMYLHRTFAPGKWTTICLPVDITFNQFAAVFGNDAELAEPKAFRHDTPNRVQFDVDYVYGNNVLLQKNKPYIIKVNSFRNETIDKKFVADNATSGTLAEEKASNLNKLKTYSPYTNAQEGSCYLFKGISYSTNEENDKSNIETLSFDHTSDAVWPMTQITWHGTFVCPQKIDADFYSFRLTPQDKKADAEMDHVTGAIDYFRGLRCWMTANGTIAKTAGAKQLTLAVGDKVISSSTTTGISDVSSHTLPAGNIYTLTGILVRRAATSTDGLSRGIYIWNNKKIEVK